MDKENVAFDLEKFADENSELFIRNLQINGSSVQIIKCCEELSELNVELCKLFANTTQYIDKNYLNLCTEIADTIITLTQIMSVYNCFEGVADEINYKLERLRKRLLDE